MFGSRKPFPDFGDGVDNDLADDMYYNQSMFHRSDKDVSFDLCVSVLSLTLANAAEKYCL